MVKNLANASRWNSGVWEVSTAELRVGVWQPVFSWFDVAVEGRWLAGASNSLHLGCEGRPMDFLALRAGYDAGVLTGGAGFLVGPLKVDASYEAASEFTYGERIRIAAGVVF